MAFTASMRTVDGPAGVAHPKKAEPAKGGVKLVPTGARCPFGVTSVGCPICLREYHERVKKLLKRLARSALEAGAAAQAIAVAPEMKQPPPQAIVASQNMELQETRTEVTVEQQRAEDREYAKRTSIHDYPADKLEVERQIRAAGPPVNMFKGVPLDGPVISVARASDPETDAKVQEYREKQRSRKAKMLERKGVAADEATLEAPRVGELDKKILDS